MFGFNLDWLGLNAVRIGIEVEVIKHSLVFHELDLQIVIGFVVIGDQVVNGFHQRTQGFAVVFFFHQEVLLGKHLKQIHQSITALFAKRLCVGSEVRQNCNY